MTIHPSLDDGWIQEKNSIRLVSTHELRWTKHAKSSNYTVQSLSIQSLSPLGLQNQEYLKNVISDLSFHAMSLYTLIILQFDINRISILSLDL